MTHALGIVLPLAVAIAIFPVPVIAAVLLISSDHGRAKSVAFVLAWCTSLAVIGAIVLLLADTADASDAGEPATWVNVVPLVLGLALLAAALQNWRGRPETGQEAPTPGWMRTVDDFTIAKAGAAGLALSGLNPKNGTLTVAAAAEIAAVGLPPSRSAGRSPACLCRPPHPSAFYNSQTVSLALGDGSRALLDNLKGWMARNNAVIMTVLFLLIGAKLIGDAISGFA